MKTRNFTHFHLKLVILVGLIAFISVGCTTHITSPEDGDTFFSGEDIILTGYGNNILDLSLQNSEMIWVSSIDGTLGTGSPLTTQLSVGEHTITLDVPVSSDLNYIDSIHISVTDLVAYYPFNGNAEDESGNGNVGTVHGATLTTDRFENPDKAYYFDGDDYIEVPDDGSLNFGTNNFTLSAWIKTDYDGLHNVILNKFWGDVDGQRGYSFWIRDNKLAFVLARVDPDYIPGTGGVVGDTELNDNNWHHVVGVRDGNYMKIYTDGQFVNSFDGAADFNFSSTGSLQIGQETVPGYESPYYGKIDEVRIYNRALSDTEIQALYNFAE